MIFKEPQIEKFLKSPSTDIRIVLIYGTNEGLIAQYRSKFIKAVCPDEFDPFCVAYMDMEKITEDKASLLAEYNAQSLMGSRRVIVVKNADNDIYPLLSQILESNSDSLLVISSVSLKKKSALVSFAEESEGVAAVSCYDDDEKSVVSTIRQFLINEGYTITPAGLQLLCSRLSNDRKTNDEELQKLITFVGNKRDISENDVVKIVGDLSSLNLDDLTFFAASGETGKALAAYEKIIKEGSEPVSVIRNIYYHFNRLLFCKSYMEQGASPSTAITKLRPPLMFYRKDSFESQLRFWKSEKIFDVLELLYKAERDCKTTNMPAEQIVSYAVMQISSAAKRQRG